MTTAIQSDTPAIADRPSAPPAPLSPLGLVLLVTGQVLTQLDFSIVNVALDRIGASLGTDATGLVLVVASYGLSFATLLGAGGRLGDRRDEVSTGLEVDRRETGRDVVGHSAPVGEAGVEGSGIELARSHRHVRRGERVVVAHAHAAVVAPRGVRP